MSFTLLLLTPWATVYYLYTLAGICLSLTLFFIKSKITSKQKSLSNHSTNICQKGAESMQSTDTNSYFNEHEYLKDLNTGQTRLQDLPNEKKSNYSFMLKTIMICPEALAFCNTKLMSQEQFLVDVFLHCEHPQTMLLDLIDKSYFTPSLCQKLILQTSISLTLLIEFMPTTTLLNLDVIKALLSRDKNIFFHDDIFEKHRNLGKNDKAILLLLQEDSIPFNRIDPRLLENKKFMKKALQINEVIIEHAGENILSDLKIMQDITALSHKAWSFISDTLLNNPKFILEHPDLPNALRYIGPQLIQDREFKTQCYNKNPKLLYQLIHLNKDDYLFALDLTTQQFDLLYQFHHLNASHDFIIGLLKQTPNEPLMFSSTKITLAQRRSIIYNFLCPSLLSCNVFVNELSEIDPYFDAHFAASFNSACPQA